MKNRAVANWFKTVLSLACVALLSGCLGSIDTGPISNQPSSRAYHLTPHPAWIYVAPFDTSQGQWLVDRTGFELNDFKKDFQTRFTHTMVQHLTKLAPTEMQWMDEPHDHGWLITGQFVTVYQGSRFLRDTIGAGYGQTTLQLNIYVYDLDQSATQYVMAFRTGVPNPGPGKDTGEGTGSGTYPSVLNVPTGLTMDVIHTADAVVKFLTPYVNGTGPGQVTETDANTATPAPMPAAPPIAPPVPEPMAPAMPTNSAPMSSPKSSAGKNPNS